MLKRIKNWIVGLFSKGTDEQLLKDLFNELLKDKEVKDFIIEVNKDKQLRGYFLENIKTTFIYEPLTLKRKHSQAIVGTIKGKPVLPKNVSDASKAAKMTEGELVNCLNKCKEENLKVYKEEEKDHWFDFQTVQNKKSKKHELQKELDEFNDDLNELIDQAKDLEKQSKKSKKKGKK